MFEIKCDPRQCSQSCQAKQRGLRRAFEQDGTEVIIAAHDTPKVDGYYGAWWQSWPVPASQVRS